MKKYEYLTPTMKLSWRQYLFGKDVHDVDIRTATTKFLNGAGKEGYQVVSCVRKGRYLLWTLMREID